MHELNAVFQLCWPISFLQQLSDIDDHGTKPGILTVTTTRAQEYVVSCDICTSTVHCENIEFGQSVC